MAQAVLNSAIESLDKTSTLYDLYSRFYDGMTQANSVDAPDCVTNPSYETNEDGTTKTDEDGVPIVDETKINNGLADYSDILMKNSAYMLANAIISTISPGGSGGGTAGSGFVSRSGDTMKGVFGALYGFEAGYGNKKIFETTINASDEKWAIVSGNLQVKEKTQLDGELHLADTGIYFGGNQCIYYDSTTLKIASQNINMTGEVTVDGSISIGDTKIDENGLHFGDYDYYHSGNCNNKDTDWSMKDAHVYGNLTVDKDTILTGALNSNGGFVFSQADKKLLYSEVTETTNDDGTVIQTPYITMSSDLSIVDGHGIKFDDNYIVFVKGGTDNVVSFSAPGKVLNLGDKGTDAEGNDLVTKYISLQSDIKNYNGAYTIVSKDGDGNFPNSFSAGVANGVGSATMQTYYKGTDDYGVTFFDKVRFGAADGPSLYGDGSKLMGALPYSYVYGSATKTEQLEISMYYAATTSLFTNPVDYPNSATLHFNTGAEFFAFDKPVEADSFSIKSEKYKTRLLENALFFGDDTFIEGVTDGIRYSQNSYYDGNLSSLSFSSGFAGSGWAILEDETVGGIHATFDSLTVRKKMRVYELEVQKISVTNGSLWVSDSCSGDEVREVV